MASPCLLADSNIAFWSVFLAMLYALQIVLEYLWCVWKRMLFKYRAREMSLQLGNNSQSGKLDAIDSEVEALFI